MASVINRTTKQYFQSVNTPDYPESDWIINPDMSAVVGVPVKYWKIVDDTVAVMSADEQAQVEMAGISQKIAGKISAAMDFGKKIMIEYGTKNVMRGYNVEQTRAVAVKTSELQALILSGSLYCARQAIIDMVPDDLVTQADKDEFIAKFNAYLGIPSA